MAHRDFAGRSGSKNNKKKAKKSFNRNTLIVLALVAVFGFGLGLYFLKSKTPAPVVTTNVQPEKPQPKSVLPNRPEEVWHYIKELETRTVPVDNNPSSVEKNMRLTEEQRQVLIQMEKEQKAAEEAKKLEAQRKEQEAANAEKAAAQAQQAHCKICGNGYFRKHRFFLSRSVQTRRRKVCKEQPALQKYFCSRPSKYQCRLCRRTRTACLKTTSFLFSRKTGKQGRLKKRRDNPRSPRAWSKNEYTPAV